MEKQRIKGIQFHILGPEETKRRSAAAITQTATYYRNAPKPGGLADRRMGTHNRQIACQTCGHKVEHCTGHEGHIEFPQPVAVYHPLLLDNILKLLRSLCYFCSRLLAAAPPEDSKFVRNMREVKNLQNRIAYTKPRMVPSEWFYTLTDLSKNIKRCYHCGGCNPHYDKVTEEFKFMIHATWDESRLIPLQIGLPDFITLCQIPFFSRTVKTLLEKLQQTSDMTELDTLLEELMENDLTQEQVEALHRCVQYGHTQILKLHADMMCLIVADLRHATKNQQDHPKNSTGSIGSTGGPKPASVFPFSQLSHLNLNPETNLESNVEIISEDTNLNAETNTEPNAETNTETRELTDKLDNWDQYVYDDDVMLDAPFLLQTSTTTTMTTTTTGSKCESVIPGQFKNAKGQMLSIDTMKWKDFDPELLKQTAKRVAEQVFQDRKHEEQVMRKTFTSVEAHQIIQFMHPDDVQLLNLDPQYNHPSQWFISSLVVAPPSVRPTVMANESSRFRGQNDLTRKYSDLVKANQTMINTLKKHPDAFSAFETPPDVLDALIYLQYHTLTLMNNEHSKMRKAKSRQGQPIKSINARIVGKEGRIRGSMMGKRVDFSARTVISPDSHLNLNEIGVPPFIALNLTVAEVVNQYNWKRLTQHVEIGYGKLGGATNVITQDRTICLQICNLEQRQALKLQTGWTVERYLQNGDVVLFNRQPSLHKKSIMAHYVRIVPGKTFRLNLSCTTPYNADFDGDECNLHVPQSYLARAEMICLMAIEQQVLNAQSNKPTFGLVQDSLSGSFYVTQKDTFFTREQAMQALVHMPLIMKLKPTEQQYVLPEPAILKPEPLWTGKQLYSMLLPPMFIRAVIRKAPAATDEMDLDERCVHIRAGELLSGSLSKEMLGPVSGSIVHVLIRDFGNLYAVAFLSDAQRFINLWLTSFGLSVGLSDCITTETTQMCVKAILARANKNICDIYHYVKTTPGMKKTDVEQAVTSIVQQVLKQTGTLTVGQLTLANKFNGIATSGAKGSNINISQMMACVGQQTINTERISARTESRTLAWFSPGDQTAAARGLVAHSYIAGLNPREFFFHAQGGREGLIDTAVKTSSVGYIQRRLVKATEALQSQTDGTIRNAEGYIVSYSYGSDGLDASYLEACTLEIMTMNDQAMRDKYGPCSWFEQKQVSDQTRRDLENQLLVLFRLRNRLRQENYSLVKHSFVTKCFLPVNVERAWANHCYQWKLKQQTVNDSGRLTSSDLSGLLNQLINQIARKANQQHSFLQMETSIRSFFHIKAFCPPFVENHGFATRQCVASFFEALLYKYEKCYVDAGESVGVLAAQSMSEVLTQLTLNTFKASGVGNKTVTSGIPRLREVIDVTANIKAKTACVFLNPPFNQLQARSQVQNLAQSLIFSTLGDIITKSQLIFEQDPYHTQVSSDAKLLEVANLFRDQSLRQRASNWVIRFSLNKMECLKRNLTPVQVARVVRNFTGRWADVICSQTNCHEWILRITLYEIKKICQHIFGSSGSSMATAETFDAVPEDPVSDLTETETKTKTKTKTQTESQTTMMAEEDLLTRCGSVKLVSDSTTTVQEMERTAVHSIMLQLNQKIVIGGIPGISGVWVREVTTEYVDSQTGNIRDKKELVIDTEGSNLEALWNLDFVDWKRTVSNDIHETVELLGIEAAKQMLFTEIIRVLCEDSGDYVNGRHIALVVATMTFRGWLMSINRHGINHIDTGVTQRVSFEESMEMLMRAAMFSEYDPLQGVTENVMVGQMVPIGTGSVTCLPTPDYARMLETMQSKQQVPQPIIRSTITQWNSNSSSLSSSSSALGLGLPPSPILEPINVPESFASFGPPPSLNLLPVSSSSGSSSLPNQPQTIHSVNTTTLLPSSVVTGQPVLLPPTEEMVQFAQAHHLHGQGTKRKADSQETYQHNPPLKKSKLCYLPESPLDEEIDDPVSDLSHNHQTNQNKHNHPNNQNKHSNQNYQNYQNQNHHTNHNNSLSSKHFTRLVPRFYCPESPC